MTDVAQWQRALKIWVTRTSDALRRVRELETSLRVALEVGERGELPSKQQMATWRDLLE